MLQCYLAGATCICLGTYSVYNTEPCTSWQCHFMQSHMYTLGACVFSCNLPPALLADWLGSFSITCCCCGTDTKITVSTESWHWRRKFSHITCCTSKSNPRLFDRKFGTLPPSHPCIPDSLIDFCFLSQNFEPEKLQPMVLLFFWSADWTIVISNTVTALTHIITLT